MSNGAKAAYPHGGFRAEGLTKRELFAAKIMPAVMAAYIEANGRCIGTEHIAGNCAAHAVRIADALLAELEKKP